MTYRECAALLNGRPRKKLCNHTYLEAMGNDCFAIRYYSSYIVIIRPQLVYQINSYGFRTKTTLSRIQKYSPARIVQRKRVWYLVRSDGSEVEFVDNMLVDSIGDFTSEDIRKQMMKGALK